MTDLLNTKVTAENYADNPLTLRDNDEVVAAVHKQGRFFGKSVASGLDRNGGADIRRACWRDKREKGATP